jgi:hypothetical protein
MRMNRTDLIVQVARSFALTASGRSSDGWKAFGPLATPPTASANLSSSSAFTPAFKARCVVAVQYFSRADVDLDGVESGPRKVPHAPSVMVLFLVSTVRHRLVRY